MNRMIQWMLAAILICGASVFTACTEDNADNPAGTSEFPQSGDTWDAETGTLTVNSNPGKDAYRGQTDIVSVVFGDDVTRIGNRAFYDCHISVVDLPASVVSIGSEAFRGEDSGVYIVTIHAKGCYFGDFPFLRSILTNIYVPAEAVDTYKADYPEYENQIFAIPEAKQEDNEIIWSKALCDYIWVKNSYDHKDKKVVAHNTQGGITVTFTGTEEDSGFGWSGITLVKGEKLTFTSAVGYISKITIQAAYDEEDEPETPIAEGWTWDAAKHTFTWQGTPAASVDMVAGGKIDLSNIQVSFTIN